MAGYLVLGQPLRVSDQPNHDRIVIRYAVSMLATLKALLDPFLECDHRLLTISVHRNIPGTPTSGIPPATVPLAMWQCPQLILLPTYCAAYFGVSLNTRRPKRMLSPKGPSGIVARSGAVQVFAESATSRAFCDAKPLVRPDNRMPNARTIVIAKPQRATIARITRLLPRSACRARLQAGMCSHLQCRPEGRHRNDTLRRHITVLPVAL